MKKLCFVYRKPVKEFFSIEKVFSIIKKGLGQKFDITEISVPNNKITISRLLQNLIFASRHNADIYHVTGDIHYVVFSFPRNKTILTIHDCVFLYKSKGIKRWIQQLLFLKWPVQYCKLITTISENTKKDIVKFSGCSPDKILVIPNPIPGELGLNEFVFKETPVLLFVGITPNKNLPRVIEAIKNIRCVLHVIGKIPEYEESLLKQNDIKYESSFSLSEEELISKYRYADVILFPSLFEGFGLPILEGQATGRPVITSNIDPMKQVAGDGACFVDPYSINSIRMGIMKVLEDQDYRMELITKGSANAKRFDKEIIIEKYLSAYQLLANQ